tara:strand:+ start:3912 stop:4796 length:885 start_codon:yes stop_codon:yes gene_type:complete
MQTCTTNGQLRTALASARKKDLIIGFVPTMGNLHEGHLQLVRRAIKLCDVVVVSIFVNPLQFDAKEDLDTYPRTLNADKQKLFAEGIQLLFTPSVSEIYPEGMEVHAQVTVPDICDSLCGANRPGHFVGVATVVNKLFNIIQPDMAIFGQKDFQQLSIITKMVKDLCMPVQIIGQTTARAKDGLALSSRNILLSKPEREIAPSLHRILTECRDAIACGYDNYQELEQHARIQLLITGFDTDYFSILDSHTLKSVTEDTEDLILAVAARLGSTRLIDNITLSVNPVNDWGMLAEY